MFKICKVEKILRALSSATPYKKTKKKNLSVTYFFSSQSNCYPLIWILHSCQNNNIVKHLHDS